MKKMPCQLRELWNAFHIEKRKSYKLKGPGIQGPFIMDIYCTFVKLDESIDLNVLHFTEDIENLIERM